MKQGKYSICENCCDVTKGLKDCDCSNLAHLQPVPVVLDGIYYDVGDEVIILKLDLIESLIPNSQLHFDELDPVFAEDMQRYLGKQAVIRKITRSGYLLLAIKVAGRECDFCDYYWSPFWVRPAITTEELGFQQCLKDELFEL